MTLPDLRETLIKQLRRIAPEIDIETVNKKEELRDEWAALMTCCHTSRTRPPKFADLTVPIQAAKRSERRSEV